MSVLPYPYEKFMVAVDALATSSAPLKDRILSAYMSFMTLKSDDFRKFPEIQAEWDELMKALTAKTAVGDEGNVRATLNAASDKEARGIATRIFEIFVSIANEELGSRKS